MLLLKGKQVQSLVRGTKILHAAQYSQKFFLKMNNMKMLFAFSLSFSHEFIVSFPVMFQHAECRRGYKKSAFY